MSLHNRQTLGQFFEPLYGGSTPCHDQVHHTWAWNLCSAEEFFSFEIIVVNSELTISFFTETFFKMAATTNNNNLNTSVPVFTGSDFQVWEQKMGDYLKSQHLWHITTGAPGSTQPVEAITGAPTPAEALLQAAWDENSDQVQAIIGSHISQMLRPHIGTTCAETWTNLRTRFSTPGISEITVDMYAAYSMKLLATHNPHPNMERG